MNNKNEQKNITLLDSISKKIDGVSPRPRWYFVLRNGAIWIFGIFTFIVGSVAIAAIIFVETHAGFEYRRLTHDSSLSHFFEMLPILWIFLCVLFGIVTYQVIRNTSTGYKYRFTNIIAILVLSSVVGGIILNILGAGYNAERIIGRHVPFHKDVLTRQADIWSRPEKGLLIGKIGTYNQEERSFILNTNNLGEWIVAFDEYEPYWRVFIDSHAEVRIIGYEIGEKVFYPCSMRPILPNRIGLVRDEIKEMMQIERKINPIRSNKCKDVQSFILFSTHQ